MYVGSTWFQRLDKIKHYRLLSSFACNSNLRPYLKGVNDILGSGATGNGRSVDLSSFWRWLWGRALQENQLKTSFNTFADPRFLSGNAARLMS
jgi:hypothetical protein